MTCMIFCCLLMRVWREDVTTIDPEQQSEVSDHLQHSLLHHPLIVVHPRQSCRCWWYEQTTGGITESSLDSFLFFLIKYSDKTCYDVISLSWYLICNGFCTLIQVFWCSLINYDHRVLLAAVWNIYHTDPVTDCRCSSTNDCLTLIIFHMELIF